MYRPKPPKKPTTAKNTPSKTAPASKSAPAATTPKTTSVAEGTKVAVKNPKEKATAEKDSVVAGSKTKAGAKVVQNPATKTPVKSKKKEEEKEGF